MPDGLYKGARESSSKRTLDLLEGFDPTKNPDLVEAPGLYQDEIPHEAMRQQSLDLTDTAQRYSDSRDAMRTSLRGSYGSYEGPLMENVDDAQFEGHTGPGARSAMADFDASDSDRAFIQGAPAAPEDPADPWDTERIFREVANVIFTDEMGLMGVKWDEEGVTWNLDNFKHQITEHPYMTALTIGSYIVPMGFMWMKGARVAQRAAKVAQGVSGGVEQSAKVVKARGLFGKVGGDELAEMTQWQAMKALGPIVRFDDHTKLVKGLAFSDDVSDGRKFFDDGLMKRLRDADSDEAVAKLVSEKDLRKLLINDAHTERFMSLKAAESKGQLGKAGVMELKMWRTFGNKYSETLTDMNREAIDGVDSWLRKAEIGKWLGAAPTGLTDEAQQTMYKFYAGHATREELVAAAGEEAASYATGLGGKADELFKAQLDEGFISQETADMFTSLRGDKHTLFGAFHLPAVLKGTSGFTDIGVTSKSFLGRGKTGAPSFGGISASSDIDLQKVLSPDTMKKRGKYTTWDVIEQDLGKLETDPLRLTAGGFIRDNTIFQLHRMFRDVMTDSIMKPGVGSKVNWTASADEILALPASARKNWVGFEDMDGIMPGLGARMRGMVEKQLVKEGGGVMPESLPYVNREIVEAFFGKEGSAKAAAGSFGQLFQLMTAVHKTAKTSLNPPTHVTNTIGNLVFLGMAGMNPLSRVALTDGRNHTRIFSKLAKKMQAGGTTPDELLSRENLVKMYGNDKSRYVTTKHGDRVDMADVFSDPHIRELLETQAFESTEGFGRVKQLYTDLVKLEGDNFGSKAASTVAKGVWGTSELPGVKQTLQTMSAAYLGEDMVPKMVYVSNLLRKGWAPEAIVKEVGRRLPQYRTVGALQKVARNVTLPWVTFTAEAARITKNNMMDNPIQMMTWMRAPQMAQGLAIAGGVGYTQEEIWGSARAETRDPTTGELQPHPERGEEGFEGGVVEGLQPWAVKPDAVYVKGEQAGNIAGAFTGATTLGAVGGALGGAPGAAAGVAAGGVGGYMLGGGGVDPHSQEQQGQLGRSISLSFLPTSAINFATTHPATWAHLNPFGNEPSPGGETLRAALEVSPIQPLSIALDMMNIMTGKDSHGNEITTDDVSGQFGKMAMGLAGFLAPPFFQKYGMRIPTRGQTMTIPGVSDVGDPNSEYLGDVFDANGGQITHPKKLGTGFFGLDDTTLASLAGGASAALLAAKTTKSPVATVAAGLFGAAAAGQINTRRLHIDIGTMDDPYTNRRGEWGPDFVINGMLGGKNYKISAPAANDAEHRRQQRFKDIISISQVKAIDAARNGEMNKVWQHVEEVRKGMFLQYAGHPSGATSMANQKLQEWWSRAMKQVRLSRQATGSSEMEMAANIAKFKAIEDSITNFQRERMIEYETNQGIKRASRSDKTKLTSPY